MTAATEPTPTPLHPEAQAVINRVGEVAAHIYRERKPEGEPQPSSQLGRTSKGLADKGKIIAPPFDPEGLAVWPTRSTILPQCLQARANNIAGLGWFLHPTFAGEDVPAGAAEEQARGELFFENASLEMPFSELLQRVQLDQDTIGYGALELLRDARTGVLCGLEHARSMNLRISVADDVPTLIERKILAPDGSQWHRVKGWKRLRLYVQIRGSHQVWFREPGDPRAIDVENGEVLGPEADPSNPQHARELLVFGTYNPASVYSLPPWIGTAIAVDNSRSADEVHWHFFKNNAIPPLMIMLYGASLTAESENRFKEQFEGRKGVESFWKAMILNAMPPIKTPQGGMMDPAATITPKIEMKEITAGRATDGMFQEFDKNNRDKVMSACGVPPILIGQSTDYTRATAITSMDVAERATFVPARSLMSDRIQRFLMSDLEILHHEFKLRGNTIQNAEDIALLLDAGAKTGAISVNKSAEVLGDALGTMIPQIDEDWAALPLSVTLASLSAGLLTLDGGDGTIDLKPFGIDDTIDTNRALAMLEQWRGVLER